jgi:uncharacterized protein with GYD domain
MPTFILSLNWTEQGIRSVKETPTPDGDIIAKFAMTLATAGNVRTRTVRAWPEAEAVKLISELP